MKDQQPIKPKAVEGAVVETDPKAAPASAASAIVLRADQEEFDHKQLTTLALLSPGLAQAPRGHLAMFFHYCVRTGLDPFARQIYMIGRTNWKAADDPDEPEKTWTIQTGIDGFRAVAHRAAARSARASPTRTPSTTTPRARPTRCGSRRPTRPQSRSPSCAAPPASR